MQAMTWSGMCLIRAAQCLLDVMTQKEKKHGYTAEAKMYFAVWLVWVQVVLTPHAGLLEHAAELPQILSLSIETD